MATFFPGGVFNVSTLESASMNLRNERLKIAKAHADKNQRELARDRLNLERKEKQLMSECKRLAQKGDLNGARLIANQIASYRRIHDRNLQASVQMGTKAQSMVSDHKVNKGQVESIKGFSYANMYESFNRLENREQRYAFRMNAINHFEDSMRGSLDDAYAGGDDETAAQLTSTGSGDGVLSRTQELEIQMIMNQAMGKEKNRIYLQAPVDSATGDLEQPFTLHIKSFERPDLGASVILNPVVGTANVNVHPLFSINTATIDTIKRRIIEDPFAVGQLNLFGNGGSYVRPFELGRMHTHRNLFEPMEFNRTILDCGMEDGDVLYVRLLDGDQSSPSFQTTADEASVRQRMNRLSRN